MRHRRDNSKIRRAEPRVNPHADDARRAIRRRGQRPSRESLLARCARAPSRPEGPADRGGGAERSALDGAEHSVKLSHVMADSVARRDPMSKPVDVALRKQCDNVETMRPGTRCRSRRRRVRERRPERTSQARAAAMVIASVISLHRCLLRRRQNLCDTCCDTWGVSDPRGRGWGRRCVSGGGSLTPHTALSPLCPGRQRTPPDASDRVPCATFNMKRKNGLARRPVRLH